MAESGFSQVIGALLVIVSGLTVVLLFNKTVVADTNEATDGDLTN
jgi:hypothetical protein